MQCELRAMSETNNNSRSRSTRTSDTLPKPGRVTEVCKEWIVHEDGALAYKLQKEEVEQHYTGNKSRNAIVREDFPRAKVEQQREEEEALAKYQQMIMEQEERDSMVARQLAQKIEQEEEERRRRTELYDKHVARKIQERELRKQSPVPVGDVNSVGLPDVSDISVHKQFRHLSVREREDWPPPPPPPHHLDEGEVDEEDEERQRRIQELQDEELARRLQQEERLGGEGLDQLDRDRLLAIEAQDKELARLLQEREKAKARRARERARQRALLKKQQQECQQQEYQQQDCQQQDCAASPQDSSPRNRHRYPDPEAIEVLSPCVSPLPNIAMAIDPTYSPHSSPSHSHQGQPQQPQEFEDLDEGPVPPYMPIQGQRRTSSLEKKPKKKQAKDGCKQQ
ncbi:coiled-coil domain-containing protein 50 [Macrosteles quadrilineatus]|uniref:coiled-coil domain-containing protein 50 n=1 Tax=Macrosteles quadrilineatus TaxID=74068 RepID=UPI0023E208C6|nr:coiled-coil domain-containing protein 50 [Macrosteles quadrilineatus]